MFKKRFVNYYKYNYLVVLLFFSALILLVCYFHSLQVDYLQKKFEVQSERIEKELASSINHIKYKLEYISNDITLHKRYSLQLIDSSIQLVMQDKKLINLFPNAVIRWVDVDDNERVNSNGRITRKDLSAADEELIRLTRQAQDLFYFGAVKVSKGTNIRYLPMGIGIVDHSGSYLGTLIFDIPIASLELLTKSLVNIKYQQLYVLHQDLIPVMSVPSSPFIDVSNENVRRWLIHSQAIRAQSNHYVESNFLRFGTSHYLSRLSSLPFVIYVTDSDMLSVSEVAVIVFEHVSDFMLIILLIALLLQFIRKSSVRTSLSNDYIIFASITTVSATLVCVWLLWSMYQHHKQEKLFEFQSHVEQVVGLLERQLDYAENISRFVGRRIVQMDDKQDYDTIADLLAVRPVRKGSPYDVFSSTMLDYVDANDYLVVNGEFGVMAQPFKVHDRVYLEKGKTNPWKLHVDAPAIGNTSGEFVLPAAVGISDSKNDTHLGAISFGLNIQKLTHLVESNLLSSHISFLVLTKQFEPVLISSDNKEARSLSVEPLVNAMQFVFASGGDAGFLDEPVFFGDVEYGYYRETFKYPFIILVGWHKDISNAMFKDEILPRLVEVAGTWLFILILLFFFQMKIVSPMSRLSEAASRLSQNKLDTKIPHGGSVEVFNLAKSLLKVKYSIRREQRLKADIEKANRGKTEFLLATAHELRSPLNAIIGMADLIKKRSDDAKTQEYSQDIKDAGKELLEFISDLLDLNQAESGNFMIYHLERVDVADLIKRSIKLNISRAQKAGIKIASDIADDLPYIQGSDRRLKQVLINLLTNSIKYSPTKTVITVTAYAQSYRYKEGVCICIRDEGYGMTPVELEVALVKWGKGDGGNQIQDSFGLGLPLVKHLVQLHGGEMEITSEKGTGTHVKLWFPTTVDQSA